MTMRETSTMRVERKGVLQNKALFMLSLLCSTDISAAWFAVGRWSKVLPRTRYVAEDICWTTVTSQHICTLLDSLFWWVSAGQRSEGEQHI